MSNTNVVYVPCPGNEQPNEAGWYHVTLESDIHTQAYFSYGHWSHNHRFGGKVIKWLRPVPVDEYLNQHDVAAKQASLIDIISQLKNKTHQS